MELRPPPRITGRADMDDIKKLARWCREVYVFLKDPQFETIRFIPRSAAPTTEKGRTYYDSDDDKYKVYDGAWQDTY